MPPRAPRATLTAFIATLAAPLLVAACDDGKCKHGAERDCLEEMQQTDHCCIIATDYCVQGSWSGCWCSQHDLECVYGDGVTDTVWDPAVDYTDPHVDPVDPAPPDTGADPTEDLPDEDPVIDPSDDDPSLDPSDEDPPADTPDDDAGDVSDVPTDPAGDGDVGDSGEG